MKNKQLNDAVSVAKCRCLLKELLKATAFSPCSERALRF